MSVDLQINIAVGRGTCMWVVAPFKCLSAGVYSVSVLGSLSSRSNITKLSAVYLVTDVLARMYADSGGRGERGPSEWMFLYGQWQMDEGAHDHFEPVSKLC